MMLANHHADEIERFRAAIEGTLGLYFDEGKREFLTEVLAARLQHNGGYADVYLARLESDAAAAEWGALAQALTVPETYFFRHHEQFRAFAEVALPARLRARAAQRRLNILSAGCASGEEPYTLAILLRETPAAAGWHIDIRGVDLNAAVIDRARSARYSAWALRETSAATQRRWFRATAREYALDESIRAAVRFEQCNLLADETELWRPQTYDVVFCRNVLMYFSPQHARHLIDRIAQAVVPGGYLFLGHAETLRGLSQAFHLHHTHDTFYYQRRGARDAGAQPVSSQMSIAPFAAAAAGGGDDWMDAIRRASERIHALTDVPPQPAPAIAARWDLRAAMELLREERYAEALASIDALPPQAERDSDVLLLHAVLLANADRFAEAEQVCARLLERDELSAGARYVMALCREGAGDMAGAAEHNRAAAHLDPAFAMPRLHLGLLAHRAGNVGVAQRELAQALVLLQREEPARLLMYGGGFSREALLALCRAELKACGARV